VRWSVVVLGLLVVYAWTSGDIAVGDLFSARRVANLRRFVEVDLVPFPLRAGGAGDATFGSWAADLVGERGASGMTQTLLIAVLAIVLAGAASAVLAPLGARNLATREPFAPATLPGRPRGAGWRLASGSARVLLILLRAVPEYVWAFLLLAMLGPSAWPAVLALAIHNAGILGKLGAETMENLSPGPLAALRSLGASRAQIAVHAVLPLALPRFLLYFFYRFETCVREATVLGMLGVVSLGYWIQEARARQFYDEMALLVALGAVIVLLGDLLSAAARAALRRAT